MDRVPTKVASALLVAAVLGLACCATPSGPAPPKHKIDYVGKNTFRWGNYRGLSLISHSPSGLPQIRTDGSFYQRQVQLILAEDDEAGESGEILTEAYVPPLGDSITVDFSTFTEDGNLRITRRHCDIDYAVDLVTTRRDGLEVIGHEPVQLHGDPDPGDVLTQGTLYFDQRQGINLDEAKCRFFHAGVHYPKLAVPFLRRLETKAEDERNPIIARESLNYRDRFELLEELGPWEPPAEESS